MLFYPVCGRRKIRMIRYAGQLITIGDIERTLTERVIHVLEEKFPLQFSKTEDIDIPTVFLNPGRNQYNSTMILKELRRFEGYKILGIISADLYAENLNFVFGEAELGGKCAVISTARLRPQFYGLPPDGNLFFERTVKEAVHELGHVFGLVHCRRRNCVMFFSNTLEDTDRKESSFCRSCRKRLRFDRQI